MGSASPAPKPSTREAQALTTVSIPRSQLDALKALAAANERSVSGEVRFLIARHLEAFVP